MKSHTILALWKRITGNMLRDSVWLQAIYQEILYATTQRLKKQSQLPHQMCLPSLFTTVRT
ncbi:hypothetical protein BK796_09705 [Kosakonia pseudosacchari]|uniref:Uncharacterized protein n=1 Tax=Kosakonia pseudosacchari TaxID=1646340 RepID=A0ABX4IQZ1_9ENTR|nr:hypothetical protein BK796_09705 [Kosakonia pseudosacchari]